LLPNRAYFPMPLDSCSAKSRKSRVDLTTMKTLSADFLAIHHLEDLLVVFLDVRGAWPVPLGPSALSVFSTLAPALATAPSPSQSTARSIGASTLQPKSSSYLTSKSSSSSSTHPPHHMNIIIDGVLVVLHHRRSSSSMALHIQPEP
jgi:hypothetical protein